MTAPASSRRAPAPGARPRSGKVTDTRITLSHGSGGKAMRDLIADVFVGGFNNPLLAPLEDQARVALSDLGALGDRLAFTTDSYVVDPLFFPGGDIGSLAVNGTVNDLAVSGACPLYLSCAVILEQGLDIQILRRIVASMRDAAAEAGIQLITGDTKVVERGAADKIFITTSGIGVIPAGLDIGADRARAGDLVLVNGWIGDHGAAILGARQDLRIESPVESDCSALNGLIATLLAACPGVRCLRDATRGGLATVCNEFAQAAGVSFRLREDRIPVREPVRGLCELLGLDPLYLANEGKLVIVVPPEQAAGALAALRTHKFGRHAAIIGEVTDAPVGTTVLSTVFGGERIIDMLTGEQLPRIC